MLFQRWPQYQRSDCCTKKASNTIAATAPTVTPTVTSLGEEYFELICCHVLIFGGKNSNVVLFPASRRIVSASAADTGVLMGSLMPNSFWACVRTCSTFNPCVSSRGVSISASSSASSLLPNTRTNLTASRTSRSEERRVGKGGEWRRWQT